MTMLPPSVLQYMRQEVLREEAAEQQQERERAEAARVKLPEIFVGDTSKAEEFIYQCAAYFLAHDDEPRLASPAARVALTLT